LTHFISELQIKNFKSCIDTKLKLSPFTALVGYNNAGKSNSLSALQWLIKKSKLDESCFHNKDLPVEVNGKIEGVTEEILNQLTNAQRSSIEPYILDNVLKIKREQISPTSTPATISLSVWDEGGNEWVPNPNGIDNAIKALLPEPIRISAMENAADDVAKAKTTSTIGKLLAAFLDPVKNAHEEDLSNHLNEVRKRISADGDSRFEELNTIDDNINEKITTLFPGMSLKLHFNTPSFDDLFKSGTIKVYEGRNEGRDFTSYGHGAQRVIQMALVQYLAEVKRAGNNQSTTTLLLIDEPELYLHPFAIEQVREALLALATNGYQVIISTHSAQMISHQDAKSTLLIRKNEERGTYARKRMNDAIQQIVPNSEHQMEHLFTLSNATQVLFAENVVLTEGKTELRLLPFIFQVACNLTMGQEQYAIVPQGGVGNTQKSMKILQAMDLPVKAIVDLDYINMAIGDGFLDENDNDIATIKSVFTRMSNNRMVTLGNNGFPCKGIVKPAKAYELLAMEQDAINSIESVHQKLKLKNIWVWRKGAIEAHIGLTAKNERAWATLKNDIEQNGLEQVCPDHQSILDLVEWLRN